MRAFFAAPFPSGVPRVPRKLLGFPLFVEPTGVPDKKVEFEQARRGGLDFSGDGRVAVDMTGG